MSDTGVLVGVVVRAPEPFRNSRAGVGVAQGEAGGRGAVNVD